MPIGSVPGWLDGLSHRAPERMRAVRNQTLRPGGLPGPLPAELLAPYPAEEMTAWRVADDAKNSRIEPHPGMAEPVPV